MFSEAGFPRTANALKITILRCQKIFLVKGQNKFDTAAENDTIGFRSNVFGFIWLHCCT